MILYAELLADYQRPSARSWQGCASIGKLHRVNSTRTLLPGHTSGDPLVASRCHDNRPVADQPLPAGLVKRWSSAVGPAGPRPSAWFPARPERSPRNVAPPPRA